MPLIIRGSRLRNGNAGCRFGLLAVDIVIKLFQDVFVLFRGDDVTFPEEEVAGLILVCYAGEVLLEVRKHLQDLFTVVFCSVAMHLLALCPCILQFFVMFIEAIHIKVEEQLGLIALFGGPFIEREHKHGECDFNEGISLRWSFILLLIFWHSIPIIKRQVGVTHIITVHEHVSLVSIQKRLLEVLPSEHFFLIRVDETRINCYLIHLVSLCVIVGLDKFSGFYLLATLAIFKVIIMFVLHMQVECGITEVLLRAEAFIPRQILVELRLRTPSLLVVLLILTGWVTSLHQSIINNPTITTSHAFGYIYQSCHATQGQVQPTAHILFVIIQISMESKGKKGALMFIIFAVVWEVAVGIIYGLFFSYNEPAFSSMESITTAYSYASTSGTSTYFKTNTTQFPFPQAVVAIAIVLLIVGLSMVAGYIQRSTVTGMAFTLLIFALTVQNFFIFRNFWNRIGVNDSTSATNFSSTTYPYINSINFGNDLQIHNKLPSASFLDAVGAALAMYAGYTGVIGRIGMGEVFFLTWIGTFIYEVNSQILWRLVIPDNGYPSRAFAYGGMLGLVSSFILGKRELTKNNLNFKSSYKIMALAFLGIIFVWCSYPILVLSNVYTSTTGKVVAMMGQVNIWLALATSVLGCYTASTLSYRKFCVHDMVFASITGAIAYSSSTDINYNPGAATAIGFSIGFLASLSQTRFKRMLNQAGVIDSNSVLFHFLLPSLFAAVFSAILQGVGESASSLNYRTFTTSGSNTTFSNSTVTTTHFVGNGRTTTVQGGFQMAGWGISIGCGLVAGIIIGFVYRLLNDSFEEQIHFFNDTLYYDFPKVEAKKNQQPDASNAADPAAIAVGEPPIPIESANNL